MLQRAIFLPGGTIQSPILCVSSRLEGPPLCKWGRGMGQRLLWSQNHYLEKNPLFRNNGAVCQSILIKWHSETGICTPLTQTTFSPLSTSFLERRIS